MKAITVNLYSLASVRILARFAEQERQGTGFFLRRKGDYYLVTALHVLTGRNWKTGKPREDGFIPDKYVVMFPLYKHEGGTEHSLNWLQLQITADFEREAAPWLVHPSHKERVDVGIVPLGKMPDDLLRKVIEAGRASPETYVFAVDWEDSSSLSSAVSDSVFIIGFPENIRATGEIAIWKHGTIASEPDIPIDNLPYVLADAGTRGGMSGALVVRKERNISDLFGVYSSRFGAEDTTSQLGIIWKKEVLRDIFSNPQFGKHSLHTWLW